MAIQTQSGQDVTRTVKSGAIASGARFSKTIAEDPSLSFMNPADAVSILSPKNADGTHANLTVRVNGNDARTVVVLAGGGRATIFGPIYEISVVPDATVAGTGLDDVSIQFTGRNRIGA